MSSFITAYLAVINLVTLKILLSLILVDVLFGVVLALKNHEFTFQRLSDYLVSDGIPFIVYVAMGFPAMFIPELATALIVIGAGLIATDTAMVLEKAGQLKGIHIPKILSGL